MDTESGLTCRSHVNTNLVLIPCHVLANFALRPSLIFISAYQQIYCSCSFPKESLRPAVSCAHTISKMFFFLGIFRKCPLWLRLGDVVHATLPSPSCAAPPSSLQLCPQYCLLQATALVECCRKECPGGGFKPRTQVSHDLR